MLLLVLCSVKAFGESTYFDFSVDSPFIQSGSEFEIYFNYKLEGFGERDFLISPVVNRGLVRSSFSVLSSAPSLSILGFGKVSLSFDIWNLKTGEIYKTPKRYIWITFVCQQIRMQGFEKLNAFMNDKMEE